MSDFVAATVTSSVPQDSVQDPSGSFCTLEVPRPGELWYVRDTDCDGRISGDPVCEVRRIIDVLDDGLLIEGDGVNWIGDYSVAVCRVREVQEGWLVRSWFGFWSFVSLVFLWGSISLAFFAWGYAECRYNVIGRFLSDRFGW